MRRNVILCLILGILEASLTIRLALWALLDLGGPLGFLIVPIDIVTYYLVFAYTVKMTAVDKVIEG